MKVKLSKKEREEVVNKGYLSDQLDQRDYVTKGYLADYLKKQDYATKEYMRDMFEYYQKDMKRHIDALIEDNHHYFQAIIETLEGRFERNESTLGNHEGRIKGLETKLGY